MTSHKARPLRRRWFLSLALLLAVSVLAGALVAAWQAGEYNTRALPSQSVEEPAGAAFPAPFTVGGWNVGLDDAEPQVIAALLADFQGVDLWGLSEVNDQDGSLELLEQAAEAGESADFRAVLGASGGAMRLLALYDAQRYQLLAWQELDAINTTGSARSPLVLHLRETRSGQEFLFMVNHLYRSRAEERLRQAQLLAQWAARQTLPVVAVGDYNFDWAVPDGESDHDPAYAALTADGAWEWVRPAKLVTTQCSGWPCTYNSVLDFVFTAGPARNWPSRSEIAVVPGDFPDDARRSDHRAVLAQFAPGAEGSLPGEIALAPQQMPAQLLATPDLRTPASASVIIRSIFYNGLVPNVESDEYIVLVNQGSEPVNLNGWRINAGDENQDFRLPGYWLAPGEQVRVYTDEVHPESGGLSLRSDQAIWRNAGECGLLYDSAGSLSSKYCY